LDIPLKTVEIAALLHDIGKFYQRTGLKHDDKYNNLTKDDYGYSGAHGKWSADFVKDIWGNEVEDLVLYHHNHNKSFDPKLTNYIIRKADHHSSSEREDLDGDERSDNVEKEPLISIFSSVKLDGKDGIDEHYIPLKKLSLLDDDYSDDFNQYFKKVVPADNKNVPLDYRSLWNSFVNEVNKLNNNGNLIKPNFNTIFYLLKKYTSSIPSAAYVSKADISLFDHSKTTAALATCRYLFSKEEDLHQTNHQKVYLAINGDISGIQKFIYKVSSPQDAQSGMSKRLRGRSLYLNLLNDSIASKLMKDLGLNPSNILFSGGGRFLLIAPNTKNTVERVQSLKNEINDYFIDKFNGELYLSIVYEKCSGNDLEDFGNITKRLNDKLNRDKKHKFIDRLDKLFKIENEVNYDKTCPVCGTPTKNDDGFCCECRVHEKLGGKVKNAKFMIKCFIKKSNKNKFDFHNDTLKIGYYFEGFKKTVDFIKTLENKMINDFEEVEIIKLNDTEFLDKEVIDSIKQIGSDYQDRISLSFNFLGNTVPKHSKTTLYFEHLAQISKGANKLGVVKMDVDNLGKIFTDGFKHFDKGGSISRISTLSSQLDMFFSGFINKIAENYRVFPEVCESCKDKLGKPIKLQVQNDEDGIQNSGMDNEYNFENSSSDEDKIFYVYREKEDKVCSECEKNSIPTIHINYSGGDDLLVFGPYDDIMEFSKEFRERFRQWTCENPSITLSAGINIVDTKFPIGKAAITSDEFLEASKSCGEDKDKVTIFNDVVRWEENGKCRGYYDLISFGQILEKYVEDDKISRSMIYTLLRLWQNTFSDSNELTTSSKEWRDGSMERMRKKKYIPQFKYKLRLIKERKVRDEIDKKGIKYMPWIKIPVSWASLRTR
jgi:CRISPR-associated protein Csm1